MISNKYKNILKKYNWWNDVSEKDDKINTFIMVLDIFNNIVNLDDFTHFRRNFPPEWIYIPAIRLRDKQLWLKFWKYIKKYHNKFDENFIKISEEDYINLMINYYNNIIINWWLDYEIDYDITVTFNKNNISHVLKNYCNIDEINRFNKNVLIHPIEVYGSINKVLFYRATIENNYCNKIIDIYEEWKNTKRICKDFLNYLL